MSLILEALKKSEAERRLGQVPGLMTPVQRTAPRRRLRLPLLVALLVLLAAAAALGWWWMQPQPVADPAPMSPAASAPIVAPATNEATADATPTRPPAPRIAAPPAPTLPAELPSDPDFVSTERESRPVPAESPPPSEPPVVAPRVTPPAPARATVQTPEPPSAAPAPRAAPATPPLTHEPARALPDVPEEPLESLPRLADLSAAERDALPPLKLTMHVYAADPAARFVLIDGKRLSEGERLSRALALAEIRRDGAVLEFDGRRFLIPRL